MSSVDQKRSPLPLLRLASLSLFWCLIFFLAFKTNLRYAFGDKVAAAISALAYASLLLLSWKEAAGQRRQALLFFLAVLTPLMPILLSMLPSEEPFLLPWLILDLWLLSGGTLLFSLLLSRHKESEAPTPTPLEPSPARFAIWGVVTLGILFFLMTGATGIGRQAIIDEALWTHERIPRFFQNIQEREFENTRVSDKPGVTITLAGGTALFRFSPSPTEERQYDPQAEALSTAFRLPILLTATLLLFFLFLFVSRATNPTIGALTVLLAGTAPVLIGVSRILNPDALLWGFFSLSFFAYFAFLRTQRRQDILWSGFFFGLALLTKYVSNFLLIFFIALTPLLLANTRSPEAMRRHLLKRLEPLLLFFLVGIGTFFVLYPATWMRPDRLLKATFLSQASLVIVLPSLILLALVLADAYWWRHILLRSLVARVNRYRGILFRGLGAGFLMALALVLASVWFGVPALDFPTLLASPKSAFHFESVTPFTFFLANFYPLVFNQVPVVLLGMILGAAILSRFGNRLPFALPLAGSLFFIVAYYIGATASQVLSISRYQIAVFPIACFIAAIGIGALLTALAKRFPRHTTALFLSMALMVGGLSVFQTLLAAPHYSSYSSPLLPKHFITEYTDMGDGLYEAAAYLNSLPHAASLTVYTDRAPLCRFFVGQCLTGFANTKLLKQPVQTPYDYIVVHSNNQSRTARFITPVITNPRVIRFDRAYDFPSPEHSITLHGRPSQTIKIIRADQISLQNDVTSEVPNDISNDTSNLVP